MDGLSRVGQMFPLGDGDKNGELLEGHGKSF
jgi:hypothetical protein